KLKKYSLYTGCLIPSRYPAIELASRKVLDNLDVELIELKDTTCCPNQMAIKSTDEALWELMAGRNLAIAEKNGYDVLSLCNGCYNTLKTVNSTLKNDDKLRDKLNHELATMDLEFNGKIKVKHILEVLLDDIGVTAIEKTLKKSLDGLIAGVHYGCHVTRPEDSISFDDTKEPKSLDKLVELLGIKSIDYPDKYLCCGGGLKIASTEDAAGFARIKLMEIKESNANCIIVTCPYCRAQLESAQEEIRECYNEKFDLPIFYYTELLGLAMGFSPEELGLYVADANLESKKRLLNSIFGEHPPEKIFDETVTKEQLKICLECLACADDCSSATATDYHPEELLALALKGDLEELIRRKDIWYCMNCHECIERCPQDFGMVKLIFRLKNLAIERGICPDVISNRDTELSASGFAFKPNSELRKKMGLPEIEGAESKDILKLITGTRIKKATKECED
ncbi:MAG: heterodisulfide reductase-related iron-sulfur binding cluster, partial [Planctomycetota bacterium]